MSYWRDHEDLEYGDFPDWMVDILTIIAISFGILWVVVTVYGLGLVS